MPDSPNDTGNTPPLYEVTPTAMRTVPAIDGAPEPRAYPATGAPIPTAKAEELVPFTDEELQKATAQQAIQLARNLMFLFRNFKKNPKTSAAGLATALATIAALVWPDIPPGVETAIAIGGSIITAVLGALARDKAPVNSGVSQPPTRN